MTAEERRVELEALARAQLEAAKEALEECGEWTAQAIVLREDRTIDVIVMLLADEEHEMRTRLLLRRYCLGQPTIGMITALDLWTLTADTLPARKFDISKHPDRQECLVVSGFAPGVEFAWRLAYDRQGEKVVWRTEEPEALIVKQNGWNPWKRVV